MHLKVKDVGLRKKEIKATQKAYTTGNTTKYGRLADKTSKLIKKAKSEYYKSKAEGQRKHDSAKLIAQDNISACRL
jgi:hypothetical protein